MRESRAAVLISVSRVARPDQLTQLLNANRVPSRPPPGPDKSSVIGYLAGPGAPGRSEGFGLAGLD